MINYRRHIADHLYDAAKALELLSAKEGWHWTNNHLIIKLIWPVLQQWLAGGQHSFSDSAVGTLLRVLGAYLCSLFDVRTLK